MKSLICAIALVIFFGECFAQGHETNRVTESDVYHEYGYVPTRDGVRLAYVIWRPKKLGRYPTVFVYDPYNADGLAFDRIKLFLESGYSILGVNMRGSGCSEGQTASIYDPHEGPDGADVVEWAARQPWSTGNIGMWGTSYGGDSELEVAAQHPPHLKAITPNAVAPNLYRDTAVAGGMIQAGMDASWAFVWQPDADRAGAEVRIKGGDKECAAIRTKQLPRSNFYDDVLKHPLLDQWWKERALENLADRIEVPVLLMHSWQDQEILPESVLRLFPNLKSKHKKLVLQNGRHGQALGKFQADNDWMRWLDRWVKGEHNGAENEPSVVVRWEQDGRGASGWTTTYPTWPPPNRERQVFYLTADGKLSRSQPTPGVSQGVRTYVYPMGTELVGSNAQFALAPQALGSLSYQTNTMTDDMAILGTPILTFYFSSEQADTDFLVTLKDIDPEGNTLFLQRAYLRASLRAIDPAHTTSDYIVHAFSNYDKLVPGKIYEAKLTVGALGHVVRKGHKLELSILAPNPIPAPEMGSLPIGEPSINRVYQSAQYPSALEVPVMLGEKAQAPAPECGSLTNQPCRPAGRPSAK